MGQRPIAACDGYSTSQGLESHLWRTIMFDELHDEDWEERLSTRQDLEAHAVQFGTVDVEAQGSVGGEDGSLVRDPRTSTVPDAAAAS